MIQITSPSRIAFCLIDLNGSLGRVDLCLGVALENPKTTVRGSFNSKETVLIEGLEDYLESEARKTVQKTCEALGVAPSLSFQVISRTPEHVGLGSKTSLLMSFAAVTARLITGKELDVFELARLAQRGGTSGAGVWAFAKGGFVLDGGHSFGQFGEKTIMMPSSALSVPPGPLISRLEPSQSWSWVCVRPTLFSGLSGEAERMFFERNCPVPAEEVARTSREVLVRVLPGVANGDLDLFEAGIESIQQCGFKSKIWNIQPTIVRTAHDIMRAFGIRAIALTSFGPTLVGVLPVPNPSLNNLNAELLKIGAFEVWATKTNYNGATFLTEYNA